MKGGVAWWINASSDINAGRLLGGCQVHDGQKGQGAATRICTVDPFLNNATTSCDDTRLQQGCCDACGRHIHVRHARACIPSMCVHSNLIAYIPVHALTFLLQSACFTSPTTQSASHRACPPHHTLTITCTLSAPSPAHFPRCDQL